ncbi:hypothetical protein BW247_09285 [Acidihalobacter ferrooxydans]|uniref:Thiol:disulfide interchange protein DsbD N-terminal domain-containing protein n=1 Tax=Acidihalobacter ferrooxydans TaxID=1765967 RepID=A0A1P8UHF5_9GAMM|nr:hypothetical protein BW247_09285 [Acidihalobacter ferrooxydans]
MIETGQDLTLPIAPRTLGDIHRPAGISAAIVLLLRLGELTHKARYTQAARAALEHISSQIAANPLHWGYLLARLNALPKAQRIRLASLVRQSRTAIASQTFQVTNSAAVARLEAVRAPVGGKPGIVLYLHIATGYHVNAHTATFAYLIPTVVHLEGITPTRIEYPKAHLIEPAFAREGLRVYTGDVIIRITLPTELSVPHPIHGSLRIQACNDRICLAPALIPFTLGG